MPVPPTSYYGGNTTPDDWYSAHDMHNTALLYAVEKGGKPSNRRGRDSARDRCIFNDLRVYDPGCFVNALEPLECWRRAADGSHPGHAVRDDAHRVVEACHGY
jgi:hypothetical protein